MYVCMYVCMYFDYLISSEKIPNPESFKTIVEESTVYIHEKLVRLT